MDLLRPLKRGLCAAPVLAGLGLFSIVACSGREAPPPSFLLISLDTIRADHLGAYGYYRDTTPFLDELAQRGFLFEQAITVSENTLISHASLLTGLFPYAHGATPRGDDAQALHPAFTTLAEDLAAAGYQTAGFTAHDDWLNERWGFDQGFESFSSAYRSADVLLAEVGAWLSQRRQDRPFFAFVHLFDAHSHSRGRPYQAPPPFLGSFTSTVSAAVDWHARSPNGSQFLRAVNEGRLSLDEAELQDLRDQYDEGLAYLDDRLGNFLEKLSEAQRRNTWILIVADHGEGFMEHGRVLHSSLYDEIMRIPFLLIPPRGSALAARVPARIEQQVRLVDVRPTVLALAGLPEAPDMQGSDLTPCLRGVTRSCRSLPAPLYAAALRQDGLKLVRIGRSMALFDLQEDPGEQTNLAQEEGSAERARAMSRYLDDLRVRHENLRKKILAGAPEAPPPQLDREAEERLRALGYTD